MTTRLITIVLVDDHPILRAGIRALIEASGEFEVVGEESSGARALDLIARTTPDVAVIDISMPGLNGVNLVSMLWDRGSSTRSVVLTAHEEPAYVQQVIRAGGRGYILKRSAPDELLRALRAVMAGDLYIDPAVAGRMLQVLQKPTPVGADLSEREEEVMRAAANGFSNKEIAARLQISVKTVETYKSRSMEKLGLKTRAELMRHASTRGWI